MSRQFPKLQVAEILAQARLCLQMGYFKGALERALRLQHDPKLGLSARHIAWLARVYLGEEYVADAVRMRDVLAEIEKLYGGQGLAEYAWLAAMSNPTAGDKAIQQIFLAADAQHGVLVTWHPTAILHLAEFAFAELKNPRSAVLLTSIALGFRSVFVSLADVDRLARLLMVLDAPVSLWADWSNVLIQHMHFATNRAASARNEARNINDAEGWALAEDAASEQVVKSVLADAPNESWAILQSLAPHLDAAQLGEIIKDHITPNQVAGRRGAEQLWSEPNALRYRYFWYDMITNHEQDLVRNGDWAMFGLPTNDFSMALAQWWRALESVLKRSVVDLISSTFAQQPQLAELDRQNLSVKRQKEEAVFLDKLAVPDRAAQLTLYDILLVLKKCEATNEQGIVGSRLRLEAARTLKKYSAQIGPLTKGTWLHPAHLTDENINWFRNRSAHDAPVDLVDATVGRVLAKRVLDGFFVPVLENWGFKAVPL